MKSPFPYFGGKSRVSGDVWQRFGKVANYVEPFFGSGAVLLGRPEAYGIETVNDKDCYVANFFRALKNDPKTLAEWCCDPVNEADLQARHHWLVNQTHFVSRMKSDPDYHDVKIAGWWVWGISCWIGAGWCEGSLYKQRPHLRGAGKGIHRAVNLHTYFQDLASRFTRVRITCGDWSRVTCPGVTIGNGLTGIFLDPPYGVKAMRKKNVYTNDSLTVADDVRDWCIENGDNPLLRIALCGYEGEHEMPRWECHSWHASGGYGNIHGNNTNKLRERIWFSPHCLLPGRLKQADLFPPDAPGD